MLTNTPDLLTVKDLMHVLHIGKNTALKLLNEGYIQGYRIKGNRWRIKKRFDRVFNAKLNFID